MGKIGPKFSHLLTVRAEGADPPLTVSLTVKRPFFFFDDFPKFIIAFDQYYMNISDKNCSGTQRGSVSTLLVHIETLFFLS